MNHFPEKDKIDWANYAREMIGKLRRYKKKFFIKDDLVKFLSFDEVRKEERDMNFLVLSKCDEIGLTQKEFSYV